jgi:hypothetical protein
MYKDKAVPASPEIGRKLSIKYQYLISRKANARQIINCII